MLDPFSLMTSAVSIGLLAQASAELTVADLVVGHWVVVKGETSDDGRLVASFLEVSQPEERQEIIGTVSEVREDDDAYAVIVVDGQPSFVGPKSRLRGLDVSELEELSGKRVGIEGYWRSPRKFSVRELELRSKGRDRLMGRVDKITEEPGALRLRVLGREVLVDARTTLKVEGPLADFGLADAPRYSPIGDLERVVDDDDDIPGRAIGGGLFVGARLEWQRADERNYDLDREDANDRVDDNYSVRGEVRWAPSDRVFGLIEYRHAWRDRFDEDDGSTAEDRGRLNEAHLYFRDVLVRGLDLQLGRQDFDEEREWLYDENLDAIRLFLRRDRLRYELFAATVLSGGDPREEDARYYGALVNTEYSDDWSLGAYALSASSQLDGERRATHLGLRGLGEFVDRNDSWGELSFLTGRDSGNTLTGWAFDVGNTWSPRWAKRWYATAGMAYGSGDRGTQDGRDSTFRQTGIHDNNAKLGGITSFRYYGELLRPELANLSIMTLGIGRRFGKRESVDLVFHKYAQDFARPFLVDAELREDPDGLHTDLGWEVDLVFGSRTYDRANIELVLGRFEPGAAFPGASAAWTARVQIRGQL